MNQLTRDEFLSLFPEHMHLSILHLKKTFPDLTHVVHFQNVTLDSSHLGEQSAMAVGPSNTFKTLNDVKWIYDLPSQRQYPQNYVPGSEL